MEKVKRFLNMRAKASYTVEGSFIFGIAILLIAGGICVGFDVCKDNLSNIVAVTENLPAAAGTEASDSFRLYELAKEVRDLVTEGSSTGD